jgi:phosphatidylglycerol---prolipoprotein diacylglyceryl transferase
VHRGLFVWGPHPVLLTVGAVEVRSYAVMVALGFVVAGWVRAREVRRLGYDRDPRQAWVGVGALVGAVLGAKLGLVLFGAEAVRGAWQTLWSLDLTGKTVLGAIAGGWLGVEAAKKLVGITASTGDGFALALLIGQAIGRVGCFLEGCCHGAAWAGLGAVWHPGLGERVHPVQLYEAGLDLAVAGWIALRRDRWPPGHAFRRAVAGYALIRAALDPLRGDGRWMWGPLSAVQWACLAAAVGLGGVIWWRESRA